MVLKNLKVKIPMSKFPKNEFLKTKRRYYADILWGGVTFLPCGNFLLPSLVQNLSIIPSFCLEMHAVFKVMLLGRQEELVGPPQHSTIRIVCSSDSPVSFRAFEQP